MMTHGRRGGAPKRAAAQIAAVTLVALGLGGLFAHASGCATYANYPAIESDLAVNDPNVHPIPGLVRRAMVRVLGDDRINHRLPERWALNLPKGTGLTVAQRVLRETMEQSGATGGELVTLENETLPIYSVTRVWIRGDQGEVDVVRPVKWTGLEDRPWTLQKVTLRLRGGRYKWDVIAARARPVGTALQPELYGWPQAVVAEAAPMGDDPLPEMELEDRALGNADGNALGSGSGSSIAPEAFTTEAAPEPMDTTSAYIEPMPKPVHEPTEWHPIPQER